MWRTIGRLTSWVRLQPLLFITPVPSLARPVDVWYCFTTGKMFCQRLWIPEPSWNIQRMSPNVRDEPLSSALTQILIFDFRKYYTLHACHSHHTVWILIVLWLYFFSKTTRADRRHVSRWLRSSTTAIFISLAQLQLASIRAVPCCSWNQTILHVRPNNRGAGSTSLTHSVNIFSPFLCLFFRLRLRALKQNNVEVSSLASLSQRQPHPSLFCQIVDYQQHRTTFIHSVSNFQVAGVTRVAECWNVGQSVHDKCRQRLARKVVDQWQKVVLPLWCTSSLWCVVGIEPAVMPALQPCLSVQTQPRTIHAVLGPC